MGPFDLEEEDDGLDDDWFFASIRRYAQLCMFLVPCSVSGLDVSADGDVLAVAGKTDDGRNEMLLYRVPSKLTAGSQRAEGLDSKRDFALVAGAFEDNDCNVVKVRFVPGSQNAILVLTQRTIARWTQTQDTDLLECESKLPLDGEALDFIFCGDDVAVVFGTSQVWSFVLEGTSMTMISTRTMETTVFDIAWSDQEKELVVALGGELQTLDHKQLTTRKSLLLQPASESGRHFLNKVDPTRMAVFNAERQTLLVKSTDRENSASLELPCSPSEVLFQREDDLIATCGNDVLIFKLESDSSVTKFRHDGHRSAVTAVAPHPNVNNLIFSGTNCKRLHAWIYESS